MALRPIPDDTPVPSPHPVFGKRPGWWTRLMQPDFESYWPSYEDVRNFQRHMDLLKTDKSPLLFDPTLSTSDPRMQVWAVRNHIESEKRRVRQAAPWWKRPDLLEVR
jgi:hypothetical protein